MPEQMIPWVHWKVLTAASVKGPKYPVLFPGARIPRLIKKTCKLVTSEFLNPMYKLLVNEVAEVRF